MRTPGPQTEISKLEQSTGETLRDSSGQFVDIVYP